MEMQFPVILDGATGTELQKRGFTGDMSAEQWVLEHPESILEIQRKYVASGSNVLYAPTFGGNRQKLEERGIFNRTEEMNKALAQLSKQAADGKAWVAGLNSIQDEKDRFEIYRHRRLGQAGLPRPQRVVVERYHAGK